VTRLHLNGCSRDHISTGATPTFGTVTLRPERRSRTPKMDDDTEAFEIRTGQSTPFKSADELTRMAASPASVVHPRRALTGGYGTTRSRSASSDTREIAELENGRFRWDISLIMLLLGAGVLLPWNCVLQA
jgi:hypothetical protein